MKLSGDWMILSLRPQLMIDCILPFLQRKQPKIFFSLSNSAPGSDKVEYRHLRSVDPKCTILSTIFNRCSENRNVPDRWKTSSTILIHKKGDASDVSNFRPIALMSCIYKLFMSVIANRLISSHLRSTTTSFLIVRRVLVQPKDVMNIPLFFIP